MSKKPETDEEWTQYFHEEMKKVTGDTEAAHGTADWLLVECLKSLGYIKLVEAYNEVDKWYA